MTDDEKKAAVLFSYAVALAARRLDDGNFQGLSCASFLAYLESRVEAGVNTLDLEDRERVRAICRRQIAEVRSSLELHQADLDRYPKPYLAWSSEDQED